MTTLDLHEQYLKRAIEMAIASLQRSTGKNINPAMIQLIEQDIKAYQQGLASIKNTK